MVTEALFRGCCRQFPKAQGPLVLIGGVLVHLALGTVYTFGNMSPYVASYIRDYSSPSDLTYQEIMWIYAVTVMGQAAFMFFGGAICAKIGPILTTLLGGWIVSCGVLLTFLTVKVSFGLCLLTYGVMFGLGIGIAYPVPIACAIRWFPRHTGLVSGIVVAGFGGGAFIFDQVQTAFINPGNKSPDKADDTGTKYFSKELAGDVLGQVPPMFLILGVCYAGLTLIGALMQSYPPGYTAKNPVPKQFEGERQPLLSSGGDSTKVMSYGGDSTKVMSYGGESTKVKQSPEVTIEATEGLADIIVPDVHPLQMLKTRHFYTLWFLCLFNGQGILFISTLYKAYGQTFITDDQFLALLGSFASVFNGAGRIIWGLLVDRFSFRACMMWSNGIMVALMMTLVACPYGGKPMFFIWICAIFFAFSANFCLLPTVVAKTFGTKYMPVNFGILFSAGIVSSPIAVFLSTGLTDQIGWFGMFCVVSGCTAVGLVLTFTFNAKKTNGEDV